MPQSKSSSRAMAWEELGKGASLSRTGAQGQILGGGGWGRDGGSFIRGSGWARFSPERHLRGGHVSEGAKFRLGGSAPGAWKKSAEEFGETNSSGLGAFRFRFQH